MLTILRTLFWGTLALILAGFLHYTLPQKDVVRVVGTDIRRVDVGERPWFWARADTGQLALENRDVRFIRAVDADGAAYEYRNEDTGLGWPPYFKFNSDTLQTEAADAVGDWVVIRHYGWRNNFLSIYPNATSMRAASGPDEAAWSWTTIAIWVLVVAVLWAILSRWRRFKRARISPVLDDMDAAWDSRTAAWRERRAARRRAQAERGLDGGA